MRLQGVGLVAKQEIRTRLRTGRWRALLVVWFVIVNGLGLLFRLSMEAGGGDDENGVPMFGGVLMSVLVLVLLILPALSAQSINGDRERGTLAVLQITKLRPLEIALGKLAASWGTGLVVLSLTLPCVLLPVLEGAITIGRAVVVLAVVALLIGVTCAISQGWSALMARSITSVLLSYLTVFALLAGTPIIYQLSLPLTQSSHGGDAFDDRTERVWWLIAPNPVVVLADATPRLPEPRRRIVDGHLEVEDSPTDPLGELGREVRKIRMGDDSYYEIDHEARDGAGSPVWPYGLAFNLLMAGGAIWITTRRLRTPVTDLQRGVRIA